MGYTMSDNICPKCNNEVEKDSKFCPNCGFSLDNQKNDADEIINNFINFKDNITSKIQNKLENEDILNTNDVKELIKNLDEDSLKQLMEKHGISPSRFKLLNFNKLFDKVDINRLKDDLIELGIINPKSDSDDVETVKTKVIVEDENVENESQKPQENEVSSDETDNINIKSNEEETGEKEEIPNDEQTVPSEEEVYDESQEDSEAEIFEEQTVVENDNSEDEGRDTHDKEETLVDEESETVEDEFIEKEKDLTEDEPSSNSNICSECGFENRPNVKFCTKCGNKLI